MPKIGKGTKVKISLLALGDRTKPKEVTLTSAATETAKDTISPATVPLTGALPADAFVPAGNYVTFTAPLTGKQVTVQIIADAEEGDTSLNVSIIPEAIAASSVAEFPMKLKERTAANLGRAGNRVSATDFDSDGYADGSTTGIEQTLEIPGNWSPQDAGFATAEWGFTNAFEREFWVEEELPRISNAYSKGRVYEGPFSITNLPLEVPAAGVITGNISGAFNGKPLYTPDTPT